ncbi:MAG: response regulator [Nitrospina sp.]|jgi:CheY-like chemotaxis protein|nr:response regulator [Nitrospina sp.]
MNDQLSDQKKKDLGPPLKILLADDTAVNLTLATKLLKKRGHDITAVENGLQAFEAFKETYYDVVLMDIHMPVMDGIESTKKIQEFEISQPSRPKTPIIAMTANNEQSDHKNYLQAGMTGIITKPLSIKTVVAQIREIIDKFSE